MPRGLLPLAWFAWLLVIIFSPETANHPGNLTLAENIGQTAYAASSLAGFAALAIWTANSPTQE